MMLFIFFLLFIGINCDIQCINPIPGYDKIIAGVDLTNYDIFNGNTYLRQVIKMSCNYNHSWFNQYNNMMYSLPDQFDPPMPIPSTYLTSYVNIVASLDELSQQLNQWVTVSIKIGGLSMSQSQSYESYSKQLNVEYNNVGLQQGIVSAWNVYRTLFDIQLSDEVLESLEYVTQYNYTDDPEIWIEYFSGFGTSAFDNGVFGGMFLVESDISKNLWGQMTETEIEQQAEISYKNILSDCGGSSKYHQDLNSKYVSSTQTSQRSYGGKPINLDPNGWNDWMITIPDVPWLLSVNYVPISNFISDNHMKNIVNDALTYYGNLASAKNLSNMFDQLLDRLTNMYNGMNDLNEQTSSTCLTPDYYNYNWDPPGFCSYKFCCLVNTQLSKYMTCVQNYTNNIILTKKEIDQQISTFIITQQQINDWSLFYDNVITLLGIDVDVSITCGTTACLDFCSFYTYDGHSSCYDNSVIKYATCANGCL